MNRVFWIAASALIGFSTPLFADAPAHKTELKSDKSAICSTPAGKHDKACAATDTTAAPAPAQAQ